MLVVGICEEFYFRGFLQSRLNFYLGNIIGLILTALIFVVWHIPADIVNGIRGVQIIYNMILRLPLSLFLGFIMMKYRNIIIPVLFHFLYNISG
jgi:membrane protease YdiL (CAAX protease family)